MTANQLHQLSAALLELHKTLIDAERVSYEQTVGTISSPNHFLKLLTSDPWFAWLHPLSRHIAAIDEALEEKEPLTAEKVAALIKETKLLLVTSEAGDGFGKHYFDALQREPDVVLAHAKVAKLLRTEKTGG